MVRLRHYASAFVTGFGSVVGFETYRNGGRLPGSYAPLLIVSEKTREVIRVYSPALAAGICWILASRAWQTSAAAIALTSSNRILGFWGGWIGVGFSGIAAGAAARYFYAQKFGEHREFFDKETILKDAALSIFVFSLLGGSWRNLLPSHALFRGSFATTLTKPRISSAREVVGVIGEISGCHTCGTRHGPFHADLTPPTEVVLARSRGIFSRKKYIQECLPQCGQCAAIQSTALKNWTQNSGFNSSRLGWGGVVTHIGTARPYDTTGFILGLIAAPVIYNPNLLIL